MKFEFVGPSYVYRSLAFDAQRSINFYPAASETGTSKNDFILCPTPGRKLFATLPKQSIRGMYVVATGRVFVVSYNTLYEILSDGSNVSYGTLLTTSGNVSMTDNGVQLLIVDGTPTGGWIFTLATNVFTQIVAAGFPGFTTVCFLDGYFIGNVPNTQEYQWSSIYDGTLWDAADFASAEGSPDNLTAVVTVHRQVYLIGMNTIEVIYTAGLANSTSPFQNVQGVFIQYGAIAPFSVQQVANSVIWLGEDQSGENVVWMAEGYSPKRISTQAIEFYLSKQDTTKATSYSYQEDGHYFYVLNIPSAQTSLVYDITQQQWHERARWSSSSGMYGRDRANFHVAAFGKHLVSDYENGNIYDQNLNYNIDDTTLIRRSRTLPYITDDLEYIYFKTFQIDMQVGVGLAVDTNTANTDPQIALLYSDDGGNTWSNEILTSIGKIGEYRTRARWRRLGRSRSRIFQAYVMANVPVYLIAAHLDTERGNS